MFDNVFYGNKCELGYGVHSDIKHIVEFDASPINITETVEKHQEIKHVHKLKRRELVSQVILF